MKRETAFKVRITDILSSSYVVREGWDPNYLDLDGKKVSRVHILGTVVGMESGLYRVDDGTGSILLRSFDENPPSLEVGKVYTIIGRPREYGDDRYLVPEITKEITDKSWVALHLKELGPAPAQAEAIVVDDVPLQPQRI